MLNSAELCRLAKFGRNPSNSGRDMAISGFFKMAAAAILDFLNLKLNGRTAQEGRNASPCQIWSKSVKLLPIYDDFSTFARWRPFAILDLLPVCSDHPQRAFGLYCCAKFGWN